MPTVKETFDGMSSRFRADKAAGVNATIQYEITGDQGGVWHAIIKDGQCTVGAGPVVAAIRRASPRTTKTLPSGVEASSCVTPSPSERNSPARSSSAAPARARACAASSSPSVEPSTAPPSSKSTAASI